MLCLVLCGKSLPHADEFVARITEKFPAVVSVFLNHNEENTNVVLGSDFTRLYGKPYIEDILCGVRLCITPQSFYQVNRTQAERLYQQAADYAGLTGKETVLDLYCGTGTIGLSMAKKAKRVIGVEVVAPAIEDAHKNAERNGIVNAEFLCADAAAKLEARGERPDVIIIDPPRKGCAPELLHTVVQMNPERMVYVSCDPATLARDMRILAELGYAPQELTPVDMFPRTAHVECVTLFKRKSGNIL